MLSAQSPFQRPEIEFQIPALLIPTHDLFSFHRLTEGGEQIPGIAKSLAGHYQQASLDPRIGGPLGILLALRRTRLPTNPVFSVGPQALAPQRLCPRLGHAEKHFPLALYHHVGKTEDAKIAIADNHAARWSPLQRLLGQALFTDRFRSIHRTPGGT